MSTLSVVRIDELAGDTTDRAGRLNSELNQVYGFLVANVIKPTFLSPRIYSLYKRLCSGLHRPYGV